MAYEAPAEIETVFSRAEDLIGRLRTGENFRDFVHIRQLLSAFLNRNYFSQVSDMVRSLQKGLTPSTPGTGAGSLGGMLSALALPILTVALATAAASCYLGSPIAPGEAWRRTMRRFWAILGLGLLRVLYTPSSRAVVLIARPLKLLTFCAPQYEIEATRGVVTWPIDRGLLVARNGRGKGCLRISVERPAEETGPEIIVRVTSEVVDFHPLLAGNWLPEPLARIGRVLYGITQLRVHVIVTNAFLRSLARLELPPSVVGALRPPERSAHPLA